MSIKNTKRPNNPELTSKEGIVPSNQPISEVFAPIPITPGPFTTSSRAYINLITRALALVSPDKFKLKARFIINLTPNGDVNKLLILV